MNGILSVKDRAYYVMPDMHGDILSVKDGAYCTMNDSDIFSTTRINENALHTLSACINAFSSQHPKNYEVRS